MEHIPKKISPTGEISSAPKDFAVYVSIFLSFLYKISKKGEGKYGGKYRKKASSVYFLHIYNSLHVVGREQFIYISTISTILVIPFTLKNETFPFLHNLLCLHATYKRSNVI